MVCLVGFWLGPPHVEVPRPGSNPSHSSSPSQILNTLHRKGQGDSFFLNFNSISVFWSYMELTNCPMALGKKTMNANIDTPSHTQTMPGSSQERPGKWMTPFSCAGGDLCRTDGGRVHTPGCLNQRLQRADAELMFLATKSTWNNWVAAYHLLC